MKQYFSYFKWLYIVLGVVAALTLGAVALRKAVSSGYTRTNDAAPSQRVYDYAGVLTEKEERELEELIAVREQEIGCDLVIVTIDESVLEKYGYDPATQNTDANWEYCMMNYADDFYDERQFGYNEAWGDGALLLDNRYKAGTYDSEAGEWLSTSGRVENRYSVRMIDDLCNAVDVYWDSNPYKGYKAYIEHISRNMSSKKAGIRLQVFPLLLVSFISALVFMLSHKKGKLGEKTTLQSTYTEQNSIHFNVQRDELINKFVTHRRIETSSGGGGSHSSGGGGHHTSSGGHSHGGGGHRH